MASRGSTGAANFNGTLATSEPFGIFSFTLVITLLITPIALILTPVLYLCDTLFTGLHWFPAHIIMTIGRAGIYVDGHLQVSAVLISLVCTLAGVVLLMIARLVLTMVANLWGEFARVMLSRNNVGEP